MGLFMEWNSSRFASEFFVNRRELMRVAKIGSKSTYHRCIVELDQWGYLSYLPSNNPYKGSKIKMSIIEITDEPETGEYNPILEQVAEQYRPIHEHDMFQNRPAFEQVANPHSPINGQALVPNTNNNKHVNINKQPKDRQAVLFFFKEKGFSAYEGKKFFEYYQDRDWKTSNHQEVRDWRALANNWMDREELYGSQTRQTKKGASQIRDNLKTSKIKDYGQPL